MEFDDHDDHEEEEEEMELPGQASYDAALGNSSRGNRIGGGGDAGGGATVAAPLAAARNPASRYRECLKNHAVSIGGDAVDGCGEFMPAGAEGTLDALKCAACGCHRNFHRKESDGDPFPYRAFSSSPFYRSPVGWLHAAPHHHPPPTLALPSTSAGGGGGGHSRDDQEDVSNPSGGGGAGTPTGKKRFRTKFTQEQKDKMLAFAESLGWRIQKHDEAAVQQFCSEASIRRHVLKVWMHNNKHTLVLAPFQLVLCTGEVHHFSDPDRSSRGLALLKGTSPSSIASKKGESEPLFQLGHRITRLIRLMGWLISYALV